MDDVVGRLQHPGYPTAILLPKLRGSDFYPGGNCFPRNAPAFAGRTPTAQGRTAAPDCEGFFQGIGDLEAAARDLVTRRRASAGNGQAVRGKTYTCAEACPLDSSARAHSHFAATSLALTDAIHAFVRASSTSSGSAPPFSISSWKSRMLNLSPSSCFARSRSSRNLS